MSKPLSIFASEVLRKSRSSLQRLPVRLIGGPMLMNTWSHKAITQMLGKMVGLKLPRLPKDLTNEFEASKYKNMAEEIAIPCRIIKACVISGAITTEKVAKKTELKRYLRVLGHTAPVRLPKGAEVTMNVQPVRTGGISKAPDLRARAHIPDGWHCDVVLQFPPNLSVDQIVAAIEGAGHAIDLCDFRLEKGGEFGAFDVEFFEPKTEKEEQALVDRILKECRHPEQQVQIPPHLLKAYNALPEEKKDKAKKKITPLKRKGATEDNGASARS